MTASNTPSNDEGTASWWQGRAPLGSGAELHLACAGPLTALCRKHSGHVQTGTGAQEEGDSPTARRQPPAEACPEPRHCAELFPAREWSALLQAQNSSLQHQGQDRPTQRLPSQLQAHVGLRLQPDPRVPGPRGQRDVSESVTQKGSLPGTAALS